MIRILLVDDEPIIREGLIKRIRWDELGVELAGEAGDGEEAMKMIREKHPDIVITDIQMPDSDGIRLLKKIHDEAVKVQCIVISGYDEFEYARHAFRYGCNDYILKPIDEVELNSAIKKVCDIIGSQKQSEQEDISQSIYKLIHGAEDNWNTAPLCFDTIYLDKDTLFAVALWMSGELFQVQSEMEKQKSLGSFKDYFLIQGENIHAIIIVASENNELNMAENKVHRMFGKIMDQYPETFKHTAIGIGKPCKGLENLKDSYKSALESLSYMLLEPGTGIFTYSYAAAKKNVLISLEQYESQLYANLISGNQEGVKGLLQDIFNKTLSNRDISINSITLLLARLCHILLKVDSGLSAEIQEFLKKITDYNYIIGLQSVPNMERMIENLFVLTSQKYMYMKGGKEALVQKVINYVHNYFNEDIRLESIAAIFHVSEPYLSKTFKQVSGQNLNEFITTVRIEEAKKILLEGRVNIQDITSLVGFTDSVYFYKVFKKVTGMTPKEYKKRQLTD